MSAHEVANPPRPTGAVEKPSHPRAHLGALPWVALSVAAGVMAVSGADALSRTGHQGGSLLFWAAIVLIMFPAALRLATTGASGAERLAIVVVVGLGLYAAKVLRDPFAFTYGDELAHVPNLQSILGTGRLFGFNSILPVTPRYPGLESVAALIVHAGGVSDFAAGVITIGAARVLMGLGLYLFYERVSGSPRAAGLGALVFAASPNFLFWSAQFAYESLALPLATVVLFALIRWGVAQDRETRARWEAVVALVAAAVILTHHVTAYFLVAFLVGVCLVHWLLFDRRGAPWKLAAGVTALTVAWLTFVAGGTVGYLSPVISNALKSVIQTLNREAPTRTLFANQGGVALTPLAERVVALGGILLLGLGVLAGVRLVWRQGRRRPVLVLLVLCAVAYLGTLPLRFVPSAWETASRAGEFLFLGVGLTVALAAIWLLERGRGERPLRRVLVAGAVTTVFASGVIAGWPSLERLAEPRRVLVAGGTLDPPSVVAAEWSGRVLGGAQRVFAQDADARFFAVNGRQTAYAGSFAPDVAGLLDAKTLTPEFRALLRKYRITLVASDRRTISADNLFGFFFDVAAPALAPAASADKFNLANVDRLYDGGNLVIYGGRGLW